MIYLFPELEKILAETAKLRKKEAELKSLNESLNQKMKAKKREMERTEIKAKRQLKLIEANGESENKLTVEVEDWKQAIANAGISNEALMKEVTQETISAKVNATKMKKARADSKVATQLLNGNFKSKVEKKLADLKKLMNDKKNHCIAEEAEVLRLENEWAGIDITFTPIRLRKAVQKKITDDARLIKRKNDALKAQVSFGRR
uniref:Uncharacterized protein n=1 Tax=Rhabditophanes sp. KR3021 TaxID=114890 RepID=A0AC35UFP7_9BILA